MSTFEEFKQHLRSTLAHLYDPTYRPPEDVWAATACAPQQGVEAVQAAIIQAIEDLKPAPDVPPTARGRRIYELLSCRYIQHLTQEETAERLSITPRHMRREQVEAVHALALHLWEQSRIEEIQPPEAMTADAGPSEWRSQVKQELASLQKSAPGAVADVGETIQRARELASTLTSRYGVSLEVELAQSNLLTAIHPSALRQVLVTAISKLAPLVLAGRITLCAEREGRSVKIIITGRPTAAAGKLPDGNLIQEILDTQRGSVEVTADGDRVSFRVTLPSADKVTVLVTDDNLDLVHFYRRYTAGTRYHVVHAAQGQRLFEMIEASVPDVIVLDVMLPDIDGWELLAHLHEHHATRSIPVIICSVIQEEELALALGAALYLPKPVRRQQFIQALDQVLSQVSTRAPTVRANNAAPC